MKKILLFVAAAMVAMSANAAYYLRGNLFEPTWTPGLEMKDGTITLDVEAGKNYEFKVTDDANNWTGELGFSALAEVPEGVIETGTYGGNVGFTVPSAGQVTIAVENGSIKLTSTVGFGEFKEPEPTGKYYIAGKGVAGSGFCCDLEWNEKDCELVDNTVTYTSLPVGEYKFKVTNGTWKVSWGFSNLTSSEGFTGDNDNNVIFTLEEESDVTITFDSAAESITVVITPATSTDLEDVDAEDAVVAAFDLLGRPVAADAAGYVILQYASGKSAKVFNY